MRAPCVARVWLDACGGIAPPPHERSRPYLPFTEATSEIDVLRGIFALRTAKLPSNVLTLSCKSRPACGAHRGMVAAATERASEGAKCGGHAAVQFGAARGGSAAGPTGRRGLAACEGSWAATIPPRCHSQYFVPPFASDLPRSASAQILKNALASGAERRVDVASGEHAPRPTSYFLGRTGHGRPGRAGTRERAAAERRRFSVASREHGPRPTSPHAPEYSGEPRDRRRDNSREIVQIRTSAVATAQRAHSKLQSPPPGPAQGGGGAAAATNTGVAGANCSRRDARVQFEAAPRRLRRRASGPAAFCQLVRAVRRLLLTEAKRHSQCFIKF